MQITVGISFGLVFGYSINCRGSKQNNKNIELTEWMDLLINSYLQSIF
jgi:L-cystine uptake protein TcyP (sodium:dicarboxylate symporter family)